MAARPLLSALCLGLLACGEPLAEECVAAPDRAERLCLAATPGQLPDALSQTGCFELGEGGLVEPSDDLIPYDVASPLFSDFAEKQRFLMLPAGASLSAVDASIELPLGAALFKHFAVQGQPLETRVILRENSGYRYATYVWEDGEAALVSGGTVLTLPDGSWRVPSVKECGFCHGSDLPLLGFAPEQLHRQVCVGDAQVDQLDAFREWGAGELSSERPLVDPLGDASLDQRARAYLHANCAHCHRPGGWAVDLDLDLRASTELTDTRTCGVANQYSGGASSPAVRLVPGDVGASSLAWRMGTDGDLRMPPFGNHGDPAGIAVIEEWIAELAECPG